MKTLIAYGSKYGCVEKCAKMVSDELNGSVDLVNLKTVKNIDFSQYDKVVIGGSIYIGRIQKEVTEFCTKNLDVLMKKHIGLFICGMQDAESIVIELNTNFPKELIQKALAKEHLGGEFIFSRMSFLEKFIVKKVSKVTTDKSIILMDNIHRLSHTMNAI